MATKQNKPSWLLGQKKTPIKKATYIGISTYSSKRCWDNVSCSDITECITNDISTQLSIINTINQELAKPNGWWLTALCEAVQDCVGDAIEWYDYSDTLNSRLQENPLANAGHILYDNTISWLTATNVQSAIDEVITMLWWTWTVTSVDMSVPTGFQISWNPITSSWTLVLGYMSGYQWYTTAEATKVSYISITQAVDLDDIETRVNALDSAVVLKWTWDASAWTFPWWWTAQAGYSYIVSVAWTVDSVAFNVWDRIIAITDNASTTTFASNWFKADYTDAVSSVAWKTWVVTLQTADITDITATASELNILDWATLTTTELNYVDWVTSAIQTQLNGKASNSHTHNASDINAWTLDWDRLPAMSASKKWWVPATWTPSGKFLKDDWTWADSWIIWNNITGTSATAVINNGYIANSSALCTITLPSTAVIGSIVRIAWNGSWGREIAQNAGQVIHFGDTNSTTGATGYLQSTQRYDGVELICVATDTDWVVISSLGNITIV